MNLDLLQYETHNLQTELFHTVFYEEDFSAIGVKEFWDREFKSMAKHETKTIEDCKELQNQAKNMLSYMSDFSTTCLVKCDIKDLLQRVVRHSDFQIKEMRRISKLLSKIKGPSNEEIEDMYNDYMEDLNK